MVDVNSIIGVTICAENNASLYRIKQEVVKYIQNLEPEDMFVINDTVCKGAGEGAGHLLNLPLCRRTEDFIPLFKNNFHLVGLTDADCLKSVFIITEKWDDIVLREIRKLIEYNKQRHYGCNIIALAHRHNQDSQVFQSFDLDNLTRIIESHGKNKPTNETIS